MLDRTNFSWGLILVHCTTEDMVEWFRIIVSEMLKLSSCAGNDIPGTHGSSLVANVAIKGTTGLLNLIIASKGRSLHIAVESRQKQVRRQRRISNDSGGRLVTGGNQEKVP